MGKARGFRLVNYLRWLNMVFAVVESKRTESSVSISGAGVALPVCWTLAFASVRDRRKNPT